MSHFCSAGTALQDTLINAIKGRMKTKPHVIIIGAGIAGTTLALFLEQAGITSEIFELRETLQSGGLLNIAPNGMHVLDKIGLAKTLTKTGAPIERMIFRDGKGRRLAVVENPSAHYGFPAVSISRGALYGTATKAVTAKGIPIHYGKKIRAIRDVPGEKVRAEFTDGTMAECDLLVGADGIHSGVRQLLFPGIKAPSFTGVTGIGGFTSATEMLPGDDPQGLMMIFGADGFFGYSRSAPDETGWWINLPRTEEMSREEISAADSQEFREALLQKFSGWPVPIEKMIASTAVLMQHNIHDLPGLQSWHKDRSILIGDAAHAMSPHAGQGASTAMEDALILASLLKNVDRPVQELFAAFHRARRPRIEKIIRASRRSGNSKKITSSLMLRLRDSFLAFFLQRFGSRMNEKAYGYRAAEEAAKLVRQLNTK
jgi:2-polyprenyl-6-methoxyphenol hydroxylase-like FAD-dependent oxidoreductase